MNIRKTSLLKKSIKTIIILMVALLCATLCERLTNSFDTIFGWGYSVIFANEEKQINPQNCETEGYQIDGNKYTTNSDDPQIIVQNVATHLSNITINFCEPLTERTPIKVYFTKPEHFFSEDTSVYKIYEAGTETITVMLNRFVQDLRIDIGHAQGQSFSLESIKINERITFSKIWDGFLINRSLDWFVIYSMIFVFLGAHLLVDIRKMYSFIFHYRWVIASIFVLYMAIMQYHGSSIGIYDVWIQPGEGSEYMEPLLGEPRVIRSDEWLVSTPAKLSLSFLEDPFGEYNDILRAANTLNIHATGMGHSLSTYINPFTWGYFIDIKFGFYLAWWMRSIGCFMVSLEVCYIISQKNIIAAVVGGALIGFSPFFYWWSFNPSWLIWGQAIIVCCYYFLHDMKYLHKVLFALGIAVCGSNFIIKPYPAWAVPSGYLFAGIFVWIVVKEFPQIRKFRWKEWLLFVGALIIGFSAVGLYYFESSEYTTAITATVYPGTRFSTGGMALQNMFYYFATPLFSFSDVGNASELATMFTLYPLPTIMAVYYWIRSKKKDLLCTILLVYSFFLTLFVTVGFPEFLSKITLFSYSTEFRTLGILALIQIYLLVMVTTRYKEIPKMHPVGGVVVAVFVTGLAFWFSSKGLPENYMSLWYQILFGFIIAGICYIIASGKRKISLRITMSLLGVITVFSSWSVHPLMKGFDAIYSKPAAQEIMAIVEKEQDAKWIITDSRWVNGFLPSCGAKTINYINQYPNMELWSVLDPEGKYDFCYNRYAHIEIRLTDKPTNVELIHEDAILLELSYQDLKKINVKYIMSLVPQKSSKNVILSEVYSENGTYLYRVE